MPRPRDPAADAAILAAADELLFAEGYEALTIERVATEAGVAKTTVYRRFPTTEHLMATLLESWQAELPLVIEGDLRTRVTGLVVALARALDPAPMRRVVAELAAAAARDPGLRKRVTALWGARRDAAAAAFRAALDPDESVDTDLLLDLFIGPLYYRVVVTDAVLDDAYAMSLVDTVLRTIPTRGDHP
ncbi:TetR/AcrR family transcriptional regulator [Okibacterium endophyticum]